MQLIDVETRDSFFLENNKSRDNWQYKHVLRLLITLYKGVLTFGVLLMKFQNVLIQTKAVRFVPDSYGQDYYIVQIQS